MLNNLTNFFNIITGRMIKKVPENSDLIPLGTRDIRYGGSYKPTAISVEDFVAALSIPTEIPMKGALVGGGILIETWEEGGVKKGLIASLTNLSAGLPYTIPSQQSILIGATAQSNNNGLQNTNAIISQTGVPATTAYAAGIARLYLGGGYTDWYLPTNYELYLCYSSALVVNKLLGANGFTNNFYWGSTEFANNLSWYQGFNSGSQYYFTANTKSNNYYVRAVRTHTF
jgi:hypothetical protein